MRRCNKIVIPTTYARINILSPEEGQFGFVANDSDFDKVVTFGDLFEFVMQNLPE